MFFFFTAIHVRLLIYIYALLLAASKLLNVLGKNGLIIKKNMKNKKPIKITNLNV